MKVRAVLAGAALAAVLAGCGASVSSTKNPDPVSEQHFQDCVAAGGSYAQTDADAWSCTLPKTVVPSPTEEATP